MDRRTEQQFDSCFIAIVSGIFMLIIWVIKTIIGGIIGVAVKSAEKNPEDELRKFKSTVYEHRQIYGVTCPSCGAKNEEHKIQCYMCGREVAEPDEVVSTSTIITGTRLGLGMVAILLLIIVYGVIRNNSYTQTSNVQASNRSNNAVVSATPTTVREDAAQQEKEVVYKYLSAILYSNCTQARDYFLVASEIYDEQCVSGNFQVHRIDEVSFANGLDSDETLLVAKGRFQLGEAIYERMEFVVLRGKIKQFPKPFGSSTPQAAAPPLVKLTPTVITNLTEAEKAEIEDLAIKFVATLEKNDCAESVSYVTDPVLWNCEVVTTQVENVRELSYKVEGQQIYLHIEADFQIRSEDLDLCTVMYGTWGDYRVVKTDNEYKIGEMTGGDFETQSCELSSSDMSQLKLQFFLPLVTK